MRVAPHSSTQHVVPPKTSWLCLGPGGCPPTLWQGSAISGEDEEQLVAVCTLTARDGARSVQEQLSLPQASLLALPRSAAPLRCAMVQTPTAVQGARCCPREADSPHGPSRHPVQLVQLVQRRGSWCSAAGGSGCCGWALPSGAGGGGAGCSPLSPAELWWHQALFCL